ncbi:PilN domain-containing protein [Bhargavaea ullalensis]|uniref:Tfp pilus assembly protein PilN n=1 Tax=Bhargavaea ullalensis TaxID=1265685 RepID=A0ABV2G8Q2_9BACL
MLVDINLLPGRDRGRSKALIVSIAILLSALIFWLAFFLMANRNAEEAQRADARAEEMRTRQAELQSRLDGTETMADRAQLEGTVEWAESYRFLTAPLIRHLVSLLPVRGFITEFTYTGPHTAELSVQFDTYEQAAHYLARLKAATMVEAATMNEVTADPLEEETDEEGNPVDRNEVLVPRYIAAYTIDFVDPRDDAAGTAEEPADGEPADDTGEADETNVDVDTDVDVNVNNQGEETDTGNPADTETGDDPAGDTTADESGSGNEGGDGQ